MYETYTLIIDNVIKIVWLALMFKWLRDDTKVSDICK